MTPLLPGVVMSLSLLIFTACTQTDVVGQVSITSFDAVMNAGVDPAKVTGWVFAKVEIKDESGKPVSVDKFLKAFDLAN